SIASGDYNTATTWEKSTNGGTSYYTNDGSDGLGTGSGKTYPGSSTDAIIVSPHIVTFAATSNAKNLTINSGATLKSTTASPTVVTFRIYGTTITNNGTFGSSSGT